ncbi:MAG: hypothetical protein A2X81_06385 [Desulfobacterales bacterium GWB2_56_26]|nr:MAG: hypothetical protein A2X81_06385 [Desulfobacterales bacterium GWB2_56_26]
MRGNCRLFTGNPPALSKLIVQSAIKTHASLHDDQRFSLGDILNERPIDILAFLLKDSCFDLNPATAKKFNSRAIYQWVRIGHPDNHPGDSGIYDKPAAGWSFSRMITWLKRYIKGCSGHILRSLPNCIDFSVRCSRLFMVTFGDNAPTLDDYRSNARIWRCLS